MNFFQNVAKEYMALTSYADRLLKDENNQDLRAFMSSYGFKSKYSYVIAQCGATKAMLAVKNNEVIVTMIGVSPDIIKTMYPAIDVMKLFAAPPTMLYDCIESFIGDFMLSLSQSLHYTIRELMFANESINCLNFTGHSYGGISVTVIAIIYQMLIKAAKSQYADREEEERIDRFIKAFYSANYAYIKSNLDLYSNFKNRLESMCDLEKSSKSEVIDCLMYLEFRMFKNIQIGQIHSFGAPTIYTKKMVDFYNQIMGERHFEWHISGDMIAGLGAPGEHGLAGLIKFLNKGSERYPPGKILIINSSKYGHLCEEYLDGIMNEEYAYLISGSEFKSDKMLVPKMFSSSLVSLSRSKRYRHVFVIFLIIAWLTLSGLVFFIYLGFKNTIK